MWNYFKLWLQHKLDPHCQHCEDLVIESRICNSCETLKLENARLLDLIDKLTDKPTVEPKDETPVVEFKPLAPARVPWRIKQQALEENDRAKAKAIRDAANATNDITDIKELEDEVLNAKI